jgi:hypothetical protein
MLSSLQKLQQHDATVDDSASILWESVYKISRSSVEVQISYILLFGVVYLTWCDFAMDPTASVHQILFKSRSATETLTMIRQAFGEERMSRTRVFEWHDRFRPDRKRRDRWRAKSRACSSFSLTSRGLFTKNSSLDVWSGIMGLCQ